MANRRNVSRCRALTVGLILGLLSGGLLSGHVLAASLQRDLVLVIDNSTSMRASDRLNHGKDLIGKFMRQSGPSTHFAVIRFALKPTVVLHLTPGAEALPQLTANPSFLNYSEEGSNISLALTEALAEIRAHGRHAAIKSIILLTDSPVETGSRLKDLAGLDELNTRFVADALQTDVRVYSVALGTEADIELLQRLARKTQGEYYWAADTESLDAVFQHIGQLLALDPRGRLVADGPDNAASAAPVPATIRAAINKAIEPTPEDALPQTSYTENTPTRLPVSPRQTRRRQENAYGGDPDLSAADSPELEDDEPFELTLPIALLLTICGLLVGLLWRERRVGAGNSQRPLRHAEVSSRRTQASNVARAYLYDLTGITGRETHELNSVITVIGRVGPAPGEGLGHVVINSPTIGRRHAVIEYKHYGYWLLDQNSKNGSFVNGERASREICLSHGDRIQFHEYEFEFALSGLGLADETTTVGGQYISARSSQNQRLQ